MQASAAALWIDEVFATFDQSVTMAIHNLFYPASGFFTPFFNFISLLGKGGIALILLSFALIYFKKTRRMGTAMLIAVAVGALFTNCFLKIVIARPRPYSDENSLFYQLWLMVGQNTESDKSFPSGHTCAAFATMTGMFLAGDRRKSWTAYIFAFLMGIARIYLVVHYPSDVLGGIFVGTVAGVIGAVIMVRLPSKWYSMDIDFRRRKSPALAGMSGTEYTDYPEESLDEEALPNPAVTPESLPEGNYETDNERFFDIDLTDDTCETDSDFSIASYSDDSLFDDYTSESEPRYVNKSVKASSDRKAGGRSSGRKSSGGRHVRSN